MSFWRLRAAEFLGHPVTPVEMRATLAAAGVSIGSDGESTNLLARESMIRAARVFPDRYVIDEGTGFVGVRQ